MIRAMPVKGQKDRTLTAFGRNIARIRDQKGISQDSLAEKADLDRTYISGIERGLHYPGIKKGSPRCNAFRIIVSELSKAIGEPFRKTRNTTRNPRNA